MLAARSKIGKKLSSRATKPLNKKRLLKPSFRKRISYSRFSEHEIIEGYLKEVFY